MIKKYSEFVPKINESCFIAESCDIIGNVEIGEYSNIWYRAVIRGDVNKISIGKNTNIQEGTVVHCDFDAETVIGDNVTIGHNAIIHGCKLSNNVLIGMGAIVLNNAVIGENTIVGAGAVVTGGKEIPAGSLVLGSPGKVVRQLSDAEIESIARSAKTYVELAQNHK
jgi:carbonic anhydrase/acetyltransferase-like protein (isoleucine patch superfamily)